MTSIASKFERIYKSLSSKRNDARTRKNDILEWILGLLRLHFYRHKAAIVNSHKIIGKNVKTVLYIKFI